MRPRSLAAAVTAGALLIAACGGDDDDGAASTGPSAPPSSAAGTNVPETSAPETSGPVTSAPETSAPATSAPATSGPVTSAPGGQDVPEVELPGETPTELVVTVITPGTGPEAANGDLLLVNYVGVRSEDGTEFDNNYGSTPFPVTLGSGGVIAGWDQGLVGAQEGSRVQLDIPADLAYGETPPGEPIQPGDALSFVIDVLAIVTPPDPADAPTKAEVPLSDEPVDEPVIEEITEGDGDELAAGDTAVVHLVAARADNGEIVQSTWNEGGPLAVVLAPGQILEPLVEGLEGMHVGGRRAITVPYAAFGEGLGQLGVPAETDLVVIADLYRVL